MAASTRRTRQQARPRSSAHDHTAQILGVLLGVSGIFFTAYQIGRSSGEQSCQTAQLHGDLEELRRRLQQA